jgi:hypothetical protein
VVPIELGIVLLSEPIKDSPEGVDQRLLKTGVQDLQAEVVDVEEQLERGVAG